MQKQFANTAIQIRVWVSNYVTLLTVMWSYYVVPYHNLEAGLAYPCW